MRRHHVVDVSAPARRAWVGAHLHRAMTGADSAVGVRRATIADVGAISALHAGCISEGFLVTLGPRFLRRLYRRVLLSSRAFAFVVDDPEGVRGYVACAIDTE